MKQQNTQQPETNIAEVVSKSEAFVTKYKMQIGMAIAAIIIIIGGSIIYQTYVSEPRAKEASEAIFKAESYFAAGEFEKALNGDEQGNMGFKQIIDEFSGTPSANIANAYAGLSLAQNGNYEEAIPYLKAFDGSDKMVAPGVLSALGNCYANTGDLNSAVASSSKRQRLLTTTPSAPTVCCRPASSTRSRVTKQRRSRYTTKLKRSISHHCRQWTLRNTLTA
jgi:tetratricopeptide (TPR) repeat protein